MFPSDHVIADEKAYRATLQRGIEIASTGETIVVLGIRPTRPETGYGYIEAGAARAANLLRVRRFTEKPDDYLFVGTVVAVARTDLDFGELAWSNDWPPQTLEPSQWVWTDDYSNIVGAIIRQLNATSPEDKP